MTAYSISLVFADLLAVIGGSRRIWTFGAITLDGFQDRCNKPDSAMLPQSQFYLSMELHSIFRDFLMCTKVNLKLCTQLERYARIELTFSAWKADVLTIVRISLERFFPSGLRIVDLQQIYRSFAIEEIQYFEFLLRSDGKICKILRLVEISGVEPEGDFFRKDIWKVSPIPIISKECTDKYMWYNICTKEIRITMSDR